MSYFALGSFSMCIWCISCYCKIVPLYYTAICNILFLVFVSYSLDGEIGRGRRGLVLCERKISLRVKGKVYKTVVIIILAGMAVFFNVAGYLIEERRRWPIINASPRGQSSK